MVELIHKLIEIGFKAISNSNYATLNLLTSQFTYFNKFKFF